MIHSFMRTYSNGWDWAFVEGGLGPVLRGALRPWIFGLIGAAFLLPGLCLAASFDCNRAATSVEKLICTDRELSQIDEHLSETYQEVLRTLHDPSRLVQEREEWLSKVRERCTDRACLKDEYRNRLSVLEKLLPTLPEQFLGQWEADSRALEAIYGNLEVKKNSLSFRRTGTYIFVVLATFDDSVVLEMSKSYRGCGRYIRLGPIIKNSLDPIDRGWAGSLTFAVYKKKEVALAPKRINPNTGRMGYPGYCTWGLYSPFR